MQIDASLPPVNLKEIPALARAAEEIGFDTLWAMETMHDPFLPGAFVAEHTRRLTYGTAVAIAFARSPATMAYTAWDLAQLSHGRFILGLGTQVRPHIEKRFGMPWPESVVGKLREQVEAIRAFWHAWQHNAPLNYRGQYYKLTLMTPFFNPGPIQHPDIPIYIAGVNTGLAKLAGEVAQGFLVHPFHTPQYLREVVLPAIESGLSKEGRDRKEIRTAVTAFVVTSAEEDLFVRSQIAFYASTPSYRAVMELHGWLEAAEKLSGLVKVGKWGDLAGIITDEMLDAFAVVASADELPDRLLERYSGLADRLALYLPFLPGQRDDFWRRLVEAMNG